MKTKPERKKPETNHFEMFSGSEIPGLTFEASIPRKGRGSVYQQAIEQLLTKTGGTIAKFKDTFGARSGLKKASEKCGVKLTYALHAGGLFVRLADSRLEKKSQAISPRTTVGESKLNAVPSNEKLSNSAICILVEEQLMRGSLTSGDLIQAVRTKRSSVVPQQIYLALTYLRNKGVIKSEMIDGQTKNVLIADAVVVSA